MKFTLCPVCSSKRNNIIFKKQKYEVRKCLLCTVQFISPFPKTSEIQDIYKKGYFLGGHSGARGYRDYRDLTPNLVTEAGLKLNFIRKYIKKGQLLDIGAGTGIFVIEARKRGFKVGANDISPYVLDIMKRNRIKTFAGAIETIKLPRKYFDVITGWDVIEHIPDIKKAMQMLNHSLKMGGYIFFTTPDTDRIDAKLLRTHWYSYYKIPDHVLFLNRKSIIKLLSDSGFEVKDMKPWGFVRSLLFVFIIVFGSALVFKSLSSLINRIQIFKKGFFIPLTNSIIVAKKIGEI